MIYYCVVEVSLQVRIGFFNFAHFIVSTYAIAIHLKCHSIQMLRKLHRNEIQRETHSQKLHTVICSLYPFAYFTVSVLKYCSGVKCFLLYPTLLM